MPDAPASPDTNAGRPISPAVFACSSIHCDPDCTCVHVVGELDMATAPQLELTLRDALAQPRLVVLDLSDLAFIDTAGVHAIVNATLHAREQGRRLVVLRGPATVERLFKLTGADRQLERGDTTAGLRVGEGLDLREGRRVQ